MGWQIMPRSLPPWLPALFVLSGPETDILAKLYEFYCNDIKDQVFHFNGALVKTFTHLRPGEIYEEGFIHLTSKENPPTGMRQFDDKRSQHLPWCRPTIVSSNEAEITFWHEKKGGGVVKAYFWLKAYEYVVILKQSGRIPDMKYYILTAYTVDKAWGERNLKQSYKRRIL
jgi:hypothetical protein